MVSKSKRCFVLQVKGDSMINEHIEDGDYVVPNINKFKTALEQQGSGANIEFNISIDPQGQHNEARWGKEFPKAVEWLYFNKSGEE